MLPVLVLPPNREAAPEGLPYKASPETAGLPKRPPPCMELAPLDTVLLGLGAPKRLDGAVAMGGCAELASDLAPNALGADVGMGGWLDFLASTGFAPKTLGAAEGIGGWAPFLASGLAPKTLGADVGIGG